MLETVKLAGEAERAPGVQAHRLQDHQQDAHRCYTARGVDVTPLGTFAAAFVTSVAAFSTSTAFGTVLDPRSPTLTAAGIAIPVCRDRRGGL